MPVGQGFGAFWTKQIALVVKGGEGSFFDVVGGQLVIFAAKLFI